MSPNYPTPHIAATPADFASTVLMPGDPLRAKFIAEHFLTAPRLVNNVRGVQGYTGSFSGVPVSVMASGMGMPSMGIYAYELYTAFGVDTILRVGSAGGMTDAVQIRDIVLAMGACTDSDFAHQYHLPGVFAPLADFTLLRTAADIAAEMGVRYHVGNLFTTDAFYNESAGSPDNDPTAAFGKMGVLAVDMETAALYMTAARTGHRALAVCTVSDHLLTGEATSAAERETDFTDMVLLALKTAAAIV